VNQIACNCLKYLQKFKLPVATLDYVSSDCTNLQRSMIRTGTDNFSVPRIYSEHTQYRSFASYNKVSAYSSNYNSSSVSEHPVAYINSLLVKSRRYATIFIKTVSSLHRRINQQ
jgi:hypothetical protein